MTHSTPHFSEQDELLLREYSLIETPTRYEPVCVDEVLARQADRIWRAFRTQTLMERVALIGFMAFLAFIAWNLLTAFAKGLL